MDIRIPHIILEKKILSSDKEFDSFQPDDRDCELIAYILQIQVTHIINDRFRRKVITISNSIKEIDVVLWGQTIDELRNVLKLNAVFYFQSLTARYSARNHNLELHVTPSSNIMPIGYLGGLNDIINDNDPINIQNNPVIVNFNNIDTVPNGTLVEIKGSLKSNFVKIEREDRLIGRCILTDGQFILIIKIINFNLLDAQTSVAQHTVGTGVTVTGFVHIDAYNLITINLESIHQVVMNPQENRTIGEINLGTRPKMHV